MRGIRHAFGDLDVLHDLSLEVRPGQITSLLGPSGCGKSTLLRLAAGLETLQCGEILIDNIPVANARTGAWLPPERRQVGMVFQDFALFPHLSVMDNILFGVRRRQAERRRWAMAALEKIGLADSVDRYPHKLSGGQQQRVALLRALAPNPRVVLMDEPFSGLDATLRAQVREDTLDILRQHHTAALIVTHDPEEAMVLSDVIFVMNRGVIVQSGAPEHIYQRPADGFVAGLFGALNRWDSVVRQGRVTTPLGCFDAAERAEGEPVTVMIRPSALALIPAGGARPDNPLRAEVVDHHLLGEATDIRLQLPMADGQPPLKLRAWTPGVCRTPRGATVAIEVDADKVFVFARQAH